MVSCILERLKCSVVNMAFTSKVVSLSGLSVDEFQGLPIQFGQVLKAKNFIRCCIFSRVQTFRQSIPKCSGSPIPSLPKQLRCRLTFYKELRFKSTSI